MPKRPIIRRGEIGEQRRKTLDGRLLHSCCICGVLETWREGWSAYVSARQMDEAEPYPKFCSATCRKAGGRNASKVTAAMLQAARDREWRPPEPYYRSRNYADAVADQQRQRDHGPEDDPPPRAA